MGVHWSTGLRDIIWACCAKIIHPNHADERFSSCGKDLTEPETARERSLALRRGREGGTNTAKLHRDTCKYCTE